MQIQVKTLTCINDEVSVDFQIHSPIAADEESSGYLFARQKVSVRPTINPYGEKGFVFKRSKPDVIRKIGECLLAVADYVQSGNTVLDARRRVAA